MIASSPISPAVGGDLPSITQTSGQPTSAASTTTTTGFSSIPVTTAATLVPMGNQLLASARSGSVVWSRSTQLNVPSSPQVASSTSTSAGAYSPSADSHNPSKYSASTSTATSSSSPPTAATSGNQREQTERENMAAALFGRAVPSADSTKKEVSAAGKKEGNLRGKSIEKSSASVTQQYVAPSSSTTINNNPPLIDLLDLPTASYDSPMKLSSNEQPPLEETTNATISNTGTNQNIDLMNNIIGNQDLVPTIGTTTSNTNVTSSGISAPRAHSISDAFADLVLLDPLPATSSTLPILPTVASDMFALKSNTNIFSQISPVKMTTAEFGQRWGKLKVDTKRSLAVKCTTLQGLRDILPTCFYQVHELSIPLITKNIIAFIVLILIKYFVL